MAARLLVGEANLERRMKATTPTQRPSSSTEGDEKEAEGCEIYRGLKELFIGQDEVIEAIISPIQMHQAGLSPEGRPMFMARKMTFLANS